MPYPATRSEKLDIRLTPEDKRLLQAAAREKRRSVSEFVLESALAHAGEVLPDRQRFGLDAEQWSAFQQMLDAPPHPNEKMLQLLRTPGVFGPE